MSQSKEEIIKLIGQNSSIKEIIFDYGPDYVKKTYNIPDYEVIESVCNSDEMYVIVHFIELDFYVKINGEYDSYGGGDHFYDGRVSEVFPKTVLKTIYE